MKNLKIFGSLLVMIALGTGAYFLIRAPDHSDTKSQTTVQKAKKKSKPKKFRDAVLDNSSAQSVKTNTHMATEVTASNPQKTTPPVVTECRASFAKAWESNENFTLQNVNDESYKACLALITAQYGSTSTGLVLQECRENQSEWACAAVPYYVRVLTLALDPQYDDGNLSEWSNAVLASKILWAFNVPEEQNLEDILAWSDELIERDPDLYEAYKAKTLTLFIQETLEDNTSVSDELEDTLAKIDAFDYDDPELMQLLMTRDLINGDYESVTETANALLQQEPSDPAGAYYLAAVAWANGDKEQTRSWLEKAITMDPDFTRAKNSLDLLKDATPGQDKIFELQLSLDFIDFEG